MRFVAGELDPAHSRETFLAYAGRDVDPILFAYGAGTPQKSKARDGGPCRITELEGCDVPGGQAVDHEEYPNRVAAALKLFLWEDGA